MIASSTEARLLVLFGRAAVKAQEIEALLQETLIVVEVALDTDNRSVAAVTKRIEKLTLGRLKDQFLETIGSQVVDPNFSKMWHGINRERIFLMHKFFHVFPLSGSTDPHRAAERLARIDNLLGFGCDFLTKARYIALAKMNLTPTRLRELLALVVEHRKKRTISE